MGDSKAIAIPFTIPEDNVETEVYVGYNYGCLSATKDKNDGDSDLTLRIRSGSKSYGSSHSVALC